MAEFDRSLWEFRKENGGKYGPGGYKYNMRTGRVIPNFIGAASDITGTDTEDTVVQSQMTPKNEH